MLPPIVIRLAVAVALTGHGLAHAIAAYHLVLQVAGSVPASALEVESWLLPGLGSTGAALLALPFWLLATVGFLAVAAVFWGILRSDWAWRETAVAAALVSTVGIALFSGIWPGGDDALRALHIGAALAMNALIVVTQVVLRWPRAALLAR